MGSTADAAAEQGIATRLEFEPGQVVQEFGYDDDVDHALRESVEDVVGGELVDEDSDEVVDAVLLWWRDEDGDLVDALVDVLGALAAEGAIWLLSPKAGRSGHIEPSEIEEAAPTAGLHATRTVSVGQDWSGTRLVRPRGRRA